jgi:elongator complex protein 3
LDENLVYREYGSAIQELAEAIYQGYLRTKEQLEAAKREVARKYKLNRYPSTSELISLFPEDKRELIEPFVVNPRRSGSGIVVVTAFTAPFMCPHGTCIYCPGGPSKGTPQSYLENSPGMREAIKSGFDPFIQVRTALEKYKANGHDISKVEAIVEGGTFLSLPVEYQKLFIKGVYDGLNNSVASNLESSQLINENASSRCVGLTVETKPDWCKREHVDMMLSYGVTRVEIGVQSLSNDVLSFCNRGHTVQDVFEAIQVARDSGLKICVHMMPGLPKSSPEQDLKDLKALFTNENLMPDMTKIYPTLVVEGTALERMYKAGLYKPYEEQTVIEILSEMKRYVPRWHRIMRIQREIPSYEIEGGVKKGNLRELVLKRALEKGFRCKCIRCREVSLNTPYSLLQDDTLELRRYKYQASGGAEFFVSAEFKKSDMIAAFGRLRVPSNKAHREELKNACVIRELRVYGRVVRIGTRSNVAWQHRGLGSSIMAEMERIASEELGFGKMAVISAVGTRNYYRKLGYQRDGAYMSKRIK